MSCTRGGEENGISGLLHACTWQALGCRPYLDVAALDGEVEAGALVLHKVQGDLREALLLQVGDDGLPGELRVANHRQHLVELALDEGKLEHVLRGVDLRTTGTMVSGIPTSYAWVNAGTGGHRR